MHFPHDSSVLQYITPYAIALALTGLHKPNLRNISSLVHIHNELRGLINTKRCPKLSRINSHAVLSDLVAPSISFPMRKIVCGEHSLTVYASKHLKTFENRLFGAQNTRTIYKDDQNGSHQFSFVVHGRLLPGKRARASPTGRLGEKNSVMAATPPQHPPPANTKGKRCGN